MSDYSRIRRQQLLREAEGHLEFATLYADRWPLTRTTRDRLVKRALELLRDLPERGSSRAHILYLRGRAYRLMEQYEDAIEPLQEAARLDPENLRIWVLMGGCYKRLGRLDLAISSLEQALVVDDQEAVIHYNLACYWSLANKPALAVIYLSQAFELDPRYRDSVGAEPDFDPIRGEATFQALLSSVIV